VVTTRLDEALDGLLDFIDQMMATAQAGIFVVGLARPELMARRHDLGGRRKTVIRLEPLDDADMARLVDGDSLVRRAEGVPLFAVETVRALIDRDMVIAREGQYVPAPGLPSTSPGGTTSGWSSPPGKGRLTQLDARPASGIAAGAGASGIAERPNGVPL
jgi:hypothetical protein